MSSAIEPIDVLRAAVSFGLPGATPREMPLSSEVISLANTHRVQGLLWSAIEGGAITGEEALVDCASEALLAGLRTCLISEETAVLALAALGSAGVETRVLKGIAIAHLDHGDPAERLFGDADILIRRDDHARALAALISAGFRRARPPVRGWWERRFAKAVVLDSPRGGELDLHLAIAGGYFGALINESELWASSDSFELVGPRVQALDREARLLHACCHSVLGEHSGLRAQRDVAQVLLVTGAEWERTLTRARLHGIEIVLARAVQRTWADLGLDPHHLASEWAAAHRAEPAAERALAGYAAAADSGWGPEGQGELAALGALDRALFLCGLAFPSRSSLKSRHRTWPEHVRSGVGAVRTRA